MACLAPATIPHDNKPIRKGWPLNESFPTAAPGPYTCRASARPGAGWQRAVNVGWAADFPPQPRHSAGAAASASLVALPADAGPALPGRRTPRPWPRVVLVSHVPPAPHAFSIMASPSQVLSRTGRRTARQRSPEQKRPGAAPHHGSDPGARPVIVVGSEGRAQHSATASRERPHSPVRFPEAQETLPAVLLPPEHRRTPFHPHLIPGSRNILSHVKPPTPDPGVPGGPRAPRAACARPAPGEEPTGSRPLSQSGSGRV